MYSSSRTVIALSKVIWSCLVFPYWPALYNPHNFGVMFVYMLTFEAHVQAVVTINITILKGWKCKAGR